MRAVVRREVLLHGLVDHADLLDALRLLLGRTGIIFVEDIVSIGVLVDDHWLLHLFLASIWLRLRRPAISLATRNAWNETALVLVGRGLLLLPDLLRRDGGLQLLFRRLLLYCRVLMLIELHDLDTLVGLTS